MVRFLVWRVLQSILVLCVVYTITFSMLMMVPGDPFVGERAVPVQVRRELIERYHLEGLIDADPLHPSPHHATDKIKAFFAYTWNVIKHRNFGPAIQYEDWTVNDIIASSLPVSVSLGALAMLIAVWIGVGAGTWAALRRGQPVDVAMSVVSLFGVSVPTFVIGSVLVLIFALYLPNVLPSGGWGSLRQLILPAVSLAVYYIAIISRLTRMSVLDTVSADFVRTARAKGLPPSRVIGKHLLGNAVLPILSFLGPASAGVLTGSFVVEKIFNIPGLGRHFVNACLNTDVPLVLGSVMVYTVVILIFNILVDIAYAAMDPRTSLS